MKLSTLHADKKGIKQIKKNPDKISLNRFKKNNKSSEYGKVWVKS